MNHVVRTKYFGGGGGGGGGPAGGVGGPAVAPAVASAVASAVAPALLLSCSFCKNLYFFSFFNHLHRILC